MPRGGRRPGAGAPKGNFNAMRGGNHSYRLAMVLRASSLSPISKQSAGRWSMPASSPPGRDSTRTSAASPTFSGAAGLIVPMRLNQHSISRQPPVSAAELRDLRRQIQNEMARTPPPSTGANFAKTNHNQTALPLIPSELCPHSASPRSVASTRYDGSTAGPQKETPTMVTQTTIARDLAEARRRGVDFILAQQRADGSIGEPGPEGLSPYYKALWALAAGGELEAANRLATWIVRHVLAEEGDFAGPLRGDGFNYSYAYPNAWLICGAQKLGRFDITRRGMEFLLLLQHAEDGGFRVQRDREDAAQDVLEQLPGRQRLPLHRPHHSGEERRPLPPHRLGSAAAPRARALLRLQARRRPPHRIPRRPPAAVLDPRRHPPPDVLQHGHRRRLPRAPDDGHRQIPSGCGSASSTWTSPSTCSTRCTRRPRSARSAGAPRSSTATGGEAKYLDLATRVGRALLDQQTPEGAWDNTGGYTTEAVRTEVTCEFVVLLDEMIAGIAGR